MRFFAAFAIWLVAASLLAPALLGWWSPPEAISDLARLLDEQLTLTFLITGVIFVISQLALGYAVIKFGRRRNEPAAYFEHNNRWELLWTSAAAALFLGLTLMGYSAWAEVRFDSARTERDADALEIEVMAQQFVWNFRYAGADGRFGPYDPRLIDDSVGNPMGVDRDHPDGADDIISARLVVPADREITLLLKAKDVLHNFFVPELRIKMDTVPGLVGKLPFKADKLGVYEIACSELCGLGHYRMRAYLEVVEPAQYERWLTEQASYLE